MALSDLNSTNSTWMPATTTNIISTTTTSSPASLRTLQVALLVVQALEGLLILVVNSVTLMTLVRIPTLRTQTSKFIMSLSVSDLVSCLLPPLRILRFILQPDSTSWSFACFLEKLFLMTCLLGNVAFALTISIDRYIFMAYPLRYDVLITATRVRVVVAGIWSIIITQTLVTGVLTHLESTAACQQLKGLLVWGTFYLIVVPEFCVCFLFSFGVLTKYLLMSWKQSRQTGAWMGSVAVAGDENKELTNMLSGVVFIHAVCFTPAFIVGALMEWPSADLFIAERVASTIILISSWIKPFVYYWRNKVYHIAFIDNVQDMYKGYFAIRPMPPRVLTLPP